MSRPWRAWNVFVLVLFFSGNASASIPDFFDELFRESLIEYADFRNTEFGEFCSEHGLHSSDEKTRETFLRVYFLHDLLTTVSAINCARGGFLKIPYFWHWVEPNPRHAIVFLPDSVRLSETPPPAHYGTIQDTRRHRPGPGAFSRGLGVRISEIFAPGLRHFLHIRLVQRTGDGLCCDHDRLGLRGQDLPVRHPHVFRRLECVQTVRWDRNGPGGIYRQHIRCRFLAKSAEYGSLVAMAQIHRSGDSDSVVQQKGTFPKTDRSAGKYGSFRDLEGENPENDNRIAFRKSLIKKFYFN